VKRAARAGVAGFAGRLRLARLAGLGIVPKLDIERREVGLRGQLGKGAGVGSALDDVMAARLPRFLAAKLAGIGRVQPDRVDPRRPFLVVVAGARRLAEMVLPKVRHLMR